jgi:SM-20-related protein
MTMRMMRCRQEDALYDNEVMNTQARTARVSAVVESIAAQGYSVKPDFLDADAIAVLRARALALDDAGLLVAARVGRGAQAAERADVRGDRICWLNDAEGDPAEAPVRTALEALRTAANRELQLGLAEFEGHYAIYPPGTGYARHRDRFRDDDARVLSIVLYLNDRWRAGDGGVLRLYVEEHSVDVAPKGGTLVAMLAERFDHEVLPATRTRLSLTGWFRRRC